ncbi:MAG: NAD(P)/FAD-dependent oxidoreductase [Myxococcota bacterium]
MEKERYWSTKIPEGPWDYVVIGSGMGGMTTAATLAKLGKRVLVLEQHYVPGGFTHMFKRPGYEWDVGVHAVGEVTHHSMTGRVLAALTDGDLQWNSLGPVYDEFHFPDDFHIDFPDSPAQFRKNLEAAFPDEKDAIHRYFNLVREVSGAMKGYYLSRLAPSALRPVSDRLLAREAQRFLDQSTKDVLEGITDNPKLRSVLASQWGYYGSTPSHSSFAIQALVAKHFMHGGYYPVGGAKEIARTLLRTVANAGGWTVIRADVERIVLDRNKVSGVRLVDGQVIDTKRVVSAVGVQSTLRRLLSVPAEWARSIQDLDPAPAHVCLYFGFKGDIRSAGASPANKWFYETWSTEAEAWKVDDPDADAPILYCSFPSLKDPEHDPGPELRHTGEVVTFVPWKHFQAWKDARWKKRGDEYEALKSELADRLAKQFFRHMPELRPMVDIMELSTPATTHHFTRPMRGSIYGIEPTPKRFENPWLRPKSPIKGLYFSGSEVTTVGVIGAMMGGLLCASAAEPLGTTRFIRSTRR